MRYPLLHCTVSSLEIWILGMDVFLEEKGSLCIRFIGSLTSGMRASLNHDALCQDQHGCEVNMCMLNKTTR